jgi:hypothetical protein
VSNDRQGAGSSSQFVHEQRLEAQPAAELASCVEAVTRAVTGERAGRDPIGENHNFIDAFSQRPNLGNRGRQDGVRGVDLLCDEDDACQICLRLLLRTGVRAAGRSMKS